MVRDLKQYRTAWSAARERQTERLLAREDVARYVSQDEDIVCWYRPGELLVAPADLDTVQPLIEAHDGQLDEVDLDAGFALFRVPGDVPGLVSELREQAPGAAVGPHHLLFGAPKWRGSPGRPPAVAPTLDLDTSGDEGAEIVIAVIDTGITEQAVSIPWISAHVQFSAADLDPMDRDGDGTLDDQAGHGTFIAGIIAQVAPGATVLARRAIDSFGVSDELTVARAVRACIAEGAHIINLSLGGYTHDDAGSFVLDAACAGTVVVAAAGNDGTDRPFYPGASENVIAVGALSARSRRAAFSNYGDWVDACADGDLVHSIFVTGHEETDGDGDGQPDDFVEPFAYWSGTSFAAPQVSATIAALASTQGITVTEAAGLVLARTSTVAGVGVRVMTRVHSNSLRAVTA
jgi:subtilisin family serine protease